MADKQVVTLNLFGYEIKLSILLCTLKNGINVFLHFVNQTEPSQIEIKRSLIKYISAIELIAVQKIILGEGEIK